MDDREAWVRFAAASLAGLNASRGYPADEAADVAAKDADALLVEYRGRFGTGCADCGALKGEACRRTDEYRCAPGCEEALQRIVLVIDEFRAEQRAIDEGYDVHIGCLGEVDAGSFCHGCNTRVSDACVVRIASVETD